MSIYTAYAEYGRQLRHQLHQCPEIGFDLPETLGIVRRELDAMGLPYTEEYGRSSIVATLNPEKKHFTIGIRADMDALPILEKSSNPYKSKNEGQMHACGHDIHTANLLATAKWMAEHKDEIHCRIMFLFTPAEEYVTPGCKELAESKLMEELDCAFALHVSSDYDAGSVAITPVSPGANSMGFTAEFFGVSSHASAQNRGVDAIRMAVEAYVAMENMVAKEFPPIEPRLLNIGVIQGGKTNNVICDYCKFFGSSRSHSNAVSEHMERRLREITEGVAAMHGGKGVFTVNKFLPFVDNNPILEKMAFACLRRTLGEDKVLTRTRNLGGEDFGYITRKVPCIMYSLGTRGEHPDTHCALHQDHFDADERCFETGIQTMVAFTKDLMDGVDFNQ